VGVLCQEVEETENLVTQSTTSLKAERHKDITLGVNEGFPFIVLLGNTRQSSCSRLRSSFRANFTLGWITGPHVKDVLLLVTRSRISTEKDTSTHSRGANYKDIAHFLFRTRETCHPDKVQDKTFKRIMPKLSARAIRHTVKSVVAVQIESSAKFNRVVA
jgi:hypothetical protein